jgi:hypothetical protein
MEYSDLQNRVASVQAMDISGLLNVKPPISLAQETY